MIEKKSDEYIKSDIKSLRTWGIIYCIVCIVTVIIFIYTAIIAPLELIHNLIILGFYSVLFTIIIAEHTIRINLNKIILEIRDMNKDLDIHYKKINDLRKRS